MPTRATRLPMRTSSTIRALSEERREVIHLTSLCFRLADKIDRDVFRLGKAVEHRGQGKLAPQAALFVTAVRMAGQLTGALIDLHPARLDIARSAQRLADVMRP